MNERRVVLTGVSVSGSRLLWAYLIVTTVAHTLTHTFVNTHFALVPVFRDELGLSIEIISLMVMIPMLIQAITYLPFGILSDRFKPSRLIALSLFIAGVGGLIVAQSKTIPVLVFGFSVISLSLSIFHPPAYSVVSELFGSRRRNVALGIHGAGGTLGMAAGPISVGLVMYFLGESNWRVSYLIWALPALLCGLLVLLMNPRTSGHSSRREVSAEVGEERVSLRSVFTPAYIAFLAIVSIRSFGGQAVSTYMTTYLKDVHGMSVDFASILFGSIPLMGIFAAPVGGYIADKRGEKYALSLTYLGQTIMLAGVAFSPGLVYLVPFVILYGFVEFIGMGPSSSLVARFTPRGRRGIAYAMYFLPFNLVGSVAPVVSAFIVKQWGIWYVFPFAIAVFITTFLLLYIMVKK